MLYSLYPIIDEKYYPCIICFMGMAHGCMPNGGTSYVLYMFSGTSREGDKGIMHATESDEEIRLLQQSLPYVIKNGIANSTFSKYSKSWEKWLKWSDRKNVTGRPADPYYVAIYINHLLFVNKNKGCITSALYAVRWGHHVVGLESPTDNPLVKLAYEGALRMCGGVRTRKDPIPVETIKEIVEQYGHEGSNLMDLRFTMVCLLGFAGFFRIDELLSTQLQHITVFPDHLQIFLPRSKPDQHREGCNCENWH